jgi:imidazolonepropionase-like amidohydrolase
LNLEILKRIHQAGILITTGSDHGNPWITSGVSLQREIWLLHKSGIPPIEVLKIATRNGAKALGILDEVGTIETGKRADMVILSADPTQDI